MNSLPHICPLGRPCRRRCPASQGRNCTDQTRDRTRRHSCICTHTDSSCHIFLSRTAGRTAHPATLDYKHRYHPLARSRHRFCRSTPADNLGQRCRWGKVDGNGFPRIPVCKGTLPSMSGRFRCCLDGTCMAESNARHKASLLRWRCTIGPRRYLPSTRGDNYNCRPRGCNSRHLSTCTSPHSRCHNFQEDRAHGTSSRGSQAYSGSSH